VRPLSTREIAEPAKKRPKFFEVSKRTEAPFAGVPAELRWRRLQIEYKGGPALGLRTANGQEPMDLVKSIGSQKPLRAGLCRRRGAAA